jgi:hypothetical protein
MTPDERQAKAGTSGKRPTMFTDRKGKPFAFLYSPSEMLATDRFFGLVRRSKGVLQGGSDAPAAALFSTADLYGIRIFKVKERELRRAIRHARAQLREQVTAGLKGDGK